VSDQNEWEICWNILISVQNPTDFLSVIYTLLILSFGFLFFPFIAWLNVNAEHSRSRERERERERETSVGVVDEKKIVS